MFSDEKFNLDDPGGWSYYWQDLHKVPKTFSKRQHGGGTHMVWAAFGFWGKVTAAFPSSRIPSISYQDLLGDNLLSFAKAIGEPFRVFHQNNAFIHTANSTWEWFLNNGVHVILWPSTSSHLNSMENKWNLLVYSNGKKYATISELKAAIIYLDWEEICQNTLKGLDRSTSDHVFKLIKNSVAYPFKTLCICKQS